MSKKVYILFSNRNRITLMLILVFGVILFLFFSPDKLEYSKRSSGIEIYYYYQGVFSLLLFFMLSFWTSNGYAVFTLERKVNQFSHYEKIRSTPRSILYSDIFKVFIYSFFIALIFHTVILIHIHINLSPIEYIPHGGDREIRPYMFTFSTDIFASLVIYILLSAIGYAVFSLFVYSLRFFISNTYIYRVIGPVSSFASFMVGVFLTGFLVDVIEVPPAIAGTFASFFMYGSLVYPEIEAIQTNYLLMGPLGVFIGAVVTYLIISSLLIFIGFRKEQRYGK